MVVTPGELLHQRNVGRTRARNGLASWTHFVERDRVLEDDALRLTTRPACARTDECRDRAVDFFRRAQVAAVQAQRTPLERDHHRPVPCQYAAVDASQTHSIQPLE